MGDEFSESQLRRAVRKKDIESVRRIVRVHPEWAAGALACGSREMVDALVSLGADVNKPWFEGVTPLMQASDLQTQSPIEVIEALLNHGAQVNAVSEFGRTALDYAVNTGYYEAISFLRKHGARSNAPATLQAPGADEIRSQLRKLIEESAQPDRESRWGQTQAFLFKWSVWYAPILFRLLAQNPEKFIGFAEYLIDTHEVSIVMWKREDIVDALLECYASSDPRPVSLAKRVLSLIGRFSANKPSEPYTRAKWALWLKDPWNYVE